MVRSCMICSALFGTSAPLLVCCAVPAMVPFSLPVNTYRREEGACMCLFR